MNANPFEIPQSSELTASHIKRQDLPTNVRNYADNLVAQIKEVYAKYGAKNFEELKENKKLSARDARKVADLLKIFKDAIEKKGSVTLHDVPTFTVLPSQDMLKDKRTGFKFDWTWEQEYREGRSISDFALTDQDLQDIGFDIGFSNQKKRQKLLQSLAQAKERKESEPEATVFDIGDAIAKKQQEDPSHPNHLSTKEVFEAIDKAGYRPATLEELLAFGQQNWKPEADPEMLTDEEGLLQHVNASQLYALGSPFTRSDGHRGVPCLGWDGGRRVLSGYGIEFVWGGADRFLVFRKASS